MRGVKLQTKGLFLSFLNHGASAAAEALFCSKIFFIISMPGKIKNAAEAALECFKSQESVEGFNEAAGNRLERLALFVGHQLNVFGRVVADALDFLVGQAPDRLGR